MKISRRGCPTHGTWFFCFLSAIKPHPHSHPSCSHSWKPLVCSHQWPERVRPRVLREGEGVAGPGPGRDGQPLALATLPTPGGARLDTRLSPADLAPGGATSCDVVAAWVPPATEGSRPLGLVPSGPKLDPSGSPGHRSRVPWSGKL